MRMDGFRNLAIGRRLPDTGQGVEVGVYRGRLSHALLKIHPGISLSMIDPWRIFTKADRFYESGDLLALQTQAEIDQAFQQASILTDFAKDRRKILRMESKEAVREFKDDSQDFVFLDADHSYEGIKEDIQLWWPKVREGGWLGGHDYEHPKFPQWGVKRAVDEFAVSMSFQVPVELDMDWTWFVWKGKPKWNTLEKIVLINDLFVPFDWVVAGPLRWRELHTKIDPDPKWLKNFTESIPCGECKVHWKVLLQLYPCPYGEGYFEWTVFIHNQVNKRLNKEQMPIEQAREIYKVAA